MINCRIANNILFQYSDYPMVKVPGSMYGYDLRVGVFCLSATKLGYENWAYYYLNSGFPFGRGIKLDDITQS